MSAAAARNSDDMKQPPDKSTVVLLLTIAADTTWRMFVPTLGGALIGLWLDGQWHTEPWCGIGGLGLGIVITAFLVRQQLLSGNKEKHGK